MNEDPAQRGQRLSAKRAGACARCRRRPRAGGRRAARAGVRDAGGVAAAVGPLLGGVLLDGIGWRAAFWVNVP
ncbi:MAG: hypothetical protein L0K01_08595, partial [Brachybacterium sp.]|nr:hypothetical protein [Brachybacterium sp.]